MRRGFLGLIGIVLVGAWVSDCGPPPVPLTGTIHYNTDCRVNLPTNTGCAPQEVYVHEATAGSGTPPAVVNCQISAASSTGLTRLRFSIGRSTSGTLTEGEGISLCGEVRGPNQDMQNTRVQLYFNGDASLNQPASVSRTTPPTPGCIVHINDLTTTSFSGQISCYDAASQTSPPKLRSISGVAGGSNPPTADPTMADFNFVSCTILTSQCPSG